MKTISSKYVKVVKHEEQKKDGFQAVEVQDNFIYKGKVIAIPEAPLYVSNRQIAINDIVIFAKYSPDSHEIVEDGVTYKFINHNDILEIYATE